MVERPLSMREAPGSIPGFSTLFITLNFNQINNMRSFDALFCELLQRVEDWNSQADQDN